MDSRTQVIVSLIFTAIGIMNWMSEGKKPKKRMIKKKQITLKGSKDDGYVLAVTDEKSKVQDIILYHDELEKVWAIIGKKLKK